MHLSRRQRYAERLIAMQDGAIAASGPPAAVLTEEVLRTVFDLDARVITDPVSGTPLVLPLGRSRRNG